jgi:hypothetical protein
LIALGFLAAKGGLDDVAVPLDGMVIATFLVQMDV